MGNVVPMQKPHCYRLLVRVVLNGQAWYHSLVIQCETEWNGPSFKEIVAWLKVKNVEDWKSGAFCGNMRAAQENLVQKVSTLSEDVKVEPDGFFVTIRPNSVTELMSVGKL